MFPEQRPRRLRMKPALRRMVRETAVSVDDLIYPIFVKEGESIKEPIDAMPGQFRYSPDRLSEIIGEVVSREIPAVLLFGIPRSKDKFGTEAHKKDGVVQQAVRRIKDMAPDLMVITDVCLCEYTSHGHCGILDSDSSVENDETLEVLAKVALSHAKAGADIIAPSDMMDGRVGIIRETLDESGFEHIPIMSYSAKYASSFYGPFREARARPLLRRPQRDQMDPANVS